VLIVTIFYRKCLTCHFTPYRFIDNSVANGYRHISIHKCHPMRYKFFVFSTIAVVVVVSVASPFFGNEFPFPAMVVGIVSHIFCYRLIPRPKEDRPVLATVFTDFRLHHFSSIGILSISYALLQGALLGLSSGFIGNALVGGYLRKFCPRDGSTNCSWTDWAQPVISDYLKWSLIAVLAIFILRVTFEFYVLIYRVAQKYLND